MPLWGDMKAPRGWGIRPAPLSSPTTPRNSDRSPPEREFPLSCFCGETLVSQTQRGSQAVSPALHTSSLPVVPLGLRVPLFRNTKSGRNVPEPRAVALCLPPSTLTQQPRRTRQASAVSWHWGTSKVGTMTQRVTAVSEGTVLKTERQSDVPNHCTSHMLNNTFLRAF